MYGLHNWVFVIHLVDNKQQTTNIKWGVEIFPIFVLENSNIFRILVIINNKKKQSYGKVLFSISCSRSRRCKR
jgi:hypothetical protein